MHNGQIIFKILIDLRIIKKTSSVYHVSPVDEQYSFFMERTDER